MDSRTIAAKETISSLSTSLSGASSRLAALEAAQRKWIPKRTNEDWRHLDPDAFPWEEAHAAASSPAKMSVDIEFQADANLPAIEAAKLQALLAIDEEDADAKFLYLHRAMTSTVAAYRIPANSQGLSARIIHRISGPAALITALVIEKGASAVIYNCWESATNGTLPAIGRIEIVLEPGARLHFLHEDKLGFHTHLYTRARVQIAEGARLDWGVLTTGSIWHAAKMEIDSQGPNAESTTYGLYCGAGERTAEHRTLQYHPCARAKSELLFKSLLKEKSRSVFQGMIRVEPAAQHTDAYQACRNLLLSPAAHTEAIPRLEILADDVRCSHGATVGTVDEDILFYLMTRGLSRAQAAAAIATGFAEEILRRVPLKDVADRWRQFVEQTISHSLT
ncbi:MAG: SufD family Fe-S cluster assembly protein [bacterium]